MGAKMVKCLTGRDISSGGQWNSGTWLPIYATFHPRGQRNTQSGRRRNNANSSERSVIRVMHSQYSLYFFFSAEWTPVSRQPLAIHMYTGYLARDIETKRKIWHEILRPKGKSDNQMRDLIQLSNLIHLFSYFVAISRAKWPLIIDQWPIRRGLKLLCMEYL